MTHLREQYWAYPMPVNAEGAEIRGEHPGRPYQLLSFYGEADAVDLPPGIWQIVCTSEEVTEEEAARIVERSSSGYLIYLVNYTCIATFYQTPKPSFRSLLTSQGCDVNKNYLILKKQ